jgi:hypothetical protein
MSSRDGTRSSVVRVPSWRASRPAWARPSPRSWPPSPNELAARTQEAASRSPSVSCVPRGRAVFAARGPAPAPQKKPRRRRWATQRMARTAYYVVGGGPPRRSPLWAGGPSGEASGVHRRAACLFGQKAGVAVSMRFYAVAAVGLASFYRQNAFANDIKRYD